MTIERKSGSEKGMIRVGISVICSACGLRKCPRGRSQPPMIIMCNFECLGYRVEPLVGDLWPGETEDDFGYACGSEGTKLIARDEASDE